MKEKRERIVKTHSVLFSFQRIWVPGCLLERPEPRLRVLDGEHALRGVLVAVRLEHVVVGVHLRDGALASLGVHGRLLEQRREALKQLHHGKLH